MTPHPYAHVSGPSSHHAFHRAGRPSTSTGRGAAQAYSPLTTNFSLGSSGTTYDPYLHYNRSGQQTLTLPVLPRTTSNSFPELNATSLSSTDSSPSVHTPSNYSGYSFPSTAHQNWTQQPVFGYSALEAPQFDAQLTLGTNTSRMGSSSLGDKSAEWSSLQVPLTTSEHPQVRAASSSSTSYQVPPQISNTGNMAILPSSSNHQAVPTSTRVHETVLPEPVVEPESVHAGEQGGQDTLPDIYAGIISLSSGTVDNASGKDGKKHACWMCHKSFDRPCTLRKHMLVHTGEKAYQCPLCQRRFSVASNLNRHTKRCGQRRSRSSVSPNSPPAEDSVDDTIIPPSTTLVPPSSSITPRTRTRTSAETALPHDPAAEAANTPAFSISGPLPIDASSSKRVGKKRPSIPSRSGSNVNVPSLGLVSGSAYGHGSASVPLHSRRQKRPLEFITGPSSPETSSPPQIQGQSTAASTAVPSASFTLPSTSAQTHHDATTHRPRKRARRAPSPFRWIPDSLKLFDLTRVDKSTPKPLPPVQPYHDPKTHVWEERDSFDDSAASRPYHPVGWTGKLPGPGLMKDETMKMGGTLLVF